MLFDDLFVEARRQLTICNSCRYCQGYCPVWPALELRSALTQGDITHLSNLCHDCRDCFSACMYTEPHEFALNPPRVFAAVRGQTYESYVWPARIPRSLHGWRGPAALTVLVACVLAVLAATVRDGDGGNPAGSPYRLLPHWVLVAVVGAPVAWGIAVTIVAVGRYWRDIHGPLRDLGRPIAWLGALGDGIRLRHMRGGGDECTYPNDVPSGQRRHFHQYLVYGLLLCVVSTVAAAVEQQFFDRLPPYPLLSVPVLSGTVGGLAATVGCTGLLVLKRASNHPPAGEQIEPADYGFLIALLALNTTGLLTLALRSTGPLYLVIVVLHVGTVLVCFCMAPYTKFMHSVYRLLSIYKDRLEQSDRVSA